MTSIAYFPVVTDADQLVDVLSRAAWYLSFCPLGSIFLPIDSHQLQKVTWRVAPGMDDAITDRFDELRRKLVFVVVQVEKDFDAPMAKGSIILRWKQDVIPHFVSAERLAAWFRGKKIYDVDPNSTRQEGGNYLDLSMALVGKSPALLSENKIKFSELVNKLGRFQRAYVMATGPSVADYKRFDFQGSLGIVCNSVILDEGLMEQVRPQILVFGDPIFHFGPSQYAASFRSKLHESAKKYKYTICIPNKYYALFTSAMPELAVRTIGIPFLKERDFNFDLDNDFTLKTTANILTFVMVPLAATFAKEIYFLGCDGRPLVDNAYFWKHNRSTQINDKMGNIREVHPGFFKIDYNDYYLDHCETLEKQLSEGEERGRKFICLGFSYIPALRCRTARDLDSAPNPVCEVTKEYPRLLVVDLTNMGGLAATSRIKASFFGDWPEDKFRIVCVGQSVPKHLVFCNQAGEMLVSETGNDEIIAAVCDYRPEVLYYRAVDDKLVHEFARRLVSGQVAPMVLHIMDDWPARLSRNNRDEFPYFDASLRLMLKSAAARLSIGQQMSNAFRERYGVDFRSFANAVDPVDFPPRVRRRDTGQSFVIRYAGALAEDMTLSSVSDVAEAVQDLSTELNVRLEIYTRSPWKQKASFRFSGMHAVTVLDQVPTHEYIKLLQQADALLVAYNFDDVSQTYTRYSMANKLPEYLASGSPVLAYGPSSVATIAYAKELGCVQLVEDRDARSLRHAIRSLVTSPSLQDRLGKAGREAAFWRHNLWSVTAELHQVLLGAAKCGGRAVIGPFSRGQAAHWNETSCIAELFSGELSGSTMIDVGAHHGSALVHFLDREWRVLAFEPDERNRRKLVERLTKHKYGALVTLDIRAISKENKESVSFYSSDVSTGISALDAFHASHRKTQEVDTVTLRDALAGQSFSSIDFLKIDTEGHDLFVLQGFPWERFLPTVIECEFEDSKTVPLGYSFHDLAEFLVEKGYTVYVSEWHPVIRYGIRHDWNCLARYPCKLADDKAWGNLLAFRDGIDESKLVEAIQRNLKFGTPSAKAASYPPSRTAPVVAENPDDTQSIAAVMLPPPTQTEPNSVAGPSASASSSPQPDVVDRGTLCMDRQPNGNNWSAPEINAQGDPICWTGAEAKATILLHTKRDREMLAVVAYEKCSTDEVLAGLRVEVDGKEVPHSVRTDVVPNCILARLPARADGSGSATELGLIFPPTPSSHGKANRRTGLAVITVSFIPTAQALPFKFHGSYLDAIRRHLGMPQKIRTAGDFPLSYFDGIAYAKANPDVEDAIVNRGMPSAIDHYIRHGYREGRKFVLATDRAPNRGTLGELLESTFDGLAYLKTYPDVANAVRLQQIPSAIYHFLEHGRHEGRIPARTNQDKACRGTLPELLEEYFQTELRKRTDAVKQELEQQISARQVTAQEQLLRLEKVVRSSVNADELAAVRKDFQRNLSTVARADELDRLRQQAESLNATLTEVQQGLSAAARSDDLARVRQETEVLQAGLAHAQRSLSVTARLEHVERLERDAAHNLERIRIELASTSAVRDAREQALGAQLEGLNFRVEQAQKEMSVAARREDLERLEREATQNLERIQILAANAAREAHEQLFGSEKDALKAGIESAKARAELAEVKAISMQREIGAETGQISKSLSELAKKLESSAVDTERLKGALTTLKAQAASDHDKIVDPKLNALNVVHYQAFPRTLAKANAERLLKHWAPILKLEIQEKELYYLAHRVCSLEDLCQGRLAASIQDVLLRVLVARATKTKNLKILEIGTLFGIGIIAMHETLAPHFQSVHFTVVDPLEGYYGAHNRDILTGVPVTRAVFEENLRRTGVARERVELIQLLSTDASAPKRLSQKRFDLLVIDADHTYAGVKNDATKFIRRVRPGGHVIFDDYGNPHWPDVKKFVDAEIVPRRDLKLVGAEWNTAVFRVRNSAGKFGARLA